MPKGPPTKRWVEWTNVDLNISKEKMKSTFGYNSIEESKHGTNESRK